MRGGGIHSDGAESYGMTGRDRNTPSPQPSLSYPILFSPLLSFLPPPRVPKGTNKPQASQCIVHRRVRFRRRCVCRKSGTGAGWQRRATEAGIVAKLPNATSSSLLLLPHTPYITTRLCKTE